MTIKKKTISLNKEKETKNDNTHVNTNIFISPNSTCKLISFENESTGREKFNLENNENLKIKIINEFEEEKSSTKDRFNINTENNKGNEENNFNENTNRERLDDNISSTKPLLRLYRKWDRSRFSFANKNNNFSNLSFSDDINNTNKNIENNLNKIIMDKEEEIKINENDNSITLNNLVNNKQVKEKNNKSLISQTELNMKFHNSKVYKNPQKETYKKIELEDKNKIINSKINQTIDKFEESKTKADQNKHEEGNDIVPDYVYDLIRKKISRHTFFKKLEKEFFNGQTDISYFEKELSHNDSWSKFIINNLEKPKIK